MLLINYALGNMYIPRYINILFAYVHTMTCRNDILYHRVYIIYKITKLSPRYHTCTHNIYVCMNECIYIYIYDCKYIIELHFCTRNIIRGRSAFLCNVRALQRTVRRRDRLITGGTYAAVCCRDSRPPPLEPPPSPSLIDTRRALILNVLRAAGGGGGGPAKTAYYIDFPTTVAEVRVLAAAATPATRT